MKRPERVAFRADSSVVIGFGHVARCLTFADYLKQQGIEALFIVRNLPGTAAETIRSRGYEAVQLPYEGTQDEYESIAKTPETAGGEDQQTDAQQTLDALKGRSVDLVVVDHYSLKKDWEQAVESEHPVLTVSDAPNRDFASSFVFDHNPSAQPTEYRERMRPDAVGLFGLTFAWIKPEFTPSRNNGDRILVFMGGADPEKATEKALQAIADSKADAGVDVIVGGQNSRRQSISDWCSQHLRDAQVHVNADLPALMKRTRVAIGAGGVSSLERAAMGIPTICVTIADNQIPIAESLHQLGAHRYLGKSDEVEAEQIATAIQELWNDEAALEFQSHAGTNIVDTRGPARTLNTLTSEPKAIQIVSDETSWINDHLPAFIASINASGHNVHWVHGPQDMQKADISFFLSCGQIITADKLALSPHNLVVHESALPKGKGWSPMTWQVLEGKNLIPVTLFEAAESVDSGAIYLQSQIPLKGDELVDDLRTAQANATFALCLRFLHDQDHVVAHTKEQQGEESFYKRRRPKDSELDPHKTIAEQFDLLRVVDNHRYPAYFSFRGREYVLKIERRDREDER